MTDSRSSLATTGRYSPLRYPGGKGKLARFVAEIVRENSLSDGTYVEPYAGGAAVAWELILTGVVRRVEINDINRPIYSFWHSVLHEAERLCAKVRDTPVDIETWVRAKKIFSNPDDFDDLDLGFAMFFLNRTNRSGILNGGVIGGREQTGQWLIDARFNKRALIERIERIAAVAGRVRLTNCDALKLLESRKADWSNKTLIYLDPPYFVKGGQLYYDSYGPRDHEAVAGFVKEQLSGHRWMVSYDDVGDIHRLYEGAPWLRYTIGYSARRRGAGGEAMFFSSGLKIPGVMGSMDEVARAPALMA